MSKVRIGLVFGGKSGEHEVSIRSAKSIYDALNRDTYDVTLMGIDKVGGWHVIEEEKLLAGIRQIETGDNTQAIVSPQKPGRLLPHGEEMEQVDVYFPIVHGTYGEDGTVQGMCELMNAAYVGAGVLGSAVGMDKEIMKRLWVQAGLPVADWVALKSHEITDNNLRRAAKRLRYPVFVKPANLGSSVGISKAHTFNELETAAKKAALYDTKILIEAAVSGRELECSVLGNENPIASVPGEVKPMHEFYDYEAKYIDEHGAELSIPAALTKKQTAAVRKLAVSAYKAVECEGMGRVDMFLKENGDLVLLEINTLPGFTSISMYPKLWEASGVAYPDLLDRLIQLALERKAKKDALVRSYEPMEQ